MDDYQQTAIIKALRASFVALDAAGNHIVSQRLTGLIRFGQLLSTLGRLAAQKGVTVADHAASVMLKELASEESSMAGNASSPRYQKLIERARKGGKVTGGRKARAARINGRKNKGRKRVVAPPKQTVEEAW